MREKTCQYGDMLNNMSLEMRRVQQLDKCNHNMCFISRKGVDISSKKDTVSDARGIEVFSPTSMRHLLFTSHLYLSRDLKSVWPVESRCYRMSHQSCIYQSTVESMTRFSVAFFYHFLQQMHVVQSSLHHMQDNRKWLFPERAIHQDVR